MKIIEGFRLRDVMGQATVVGEGVEQVNFNKLITLNSTAAYLWEQVCGRDFDPKVLARLLVDRYGIDEALAMRDAESIAAQWVELGLAR